MGTFDSRFFDGLFMTTGLEVREYLVAGQALDGDSWEFHGITNANGFVANQPPSVQIGTPLPAAAFSRWSDNGPSLRGDWSITLPAGAWTVGDRATIRIPGADLPPGSLLMSLDRTVNADSDFPLKIEYRTPNAPIKTVLHVSADQPFAERILVFPDERTDGDIVLDLMIDRPRPGRVIAGAGTETDDLGMFLRSVTVSVPDPNLAQERIARFGTGDSTVFFQRGEWYQPEAEGSWAGNAFGFRFGLKPGDVGAKTMRLDSLPDSGSQATNVSVSVNGIPFVSRRLGRDQTFPTEIEIPPALLKAGAHNRVDFECERDGASGAPHDKPHIERCLFVKSFGLAQSTELAGTKISFGLGTVGSRFMLGGWRDSNDNGSWGSSRFRVRLPLAAALERSSSIAFEGSANTKLEGGGEQVNVLLNGEHLASWNLAQGASLPALTIPVAKGDPLSTLELEFHCRSGSDPCLFMRGAEITPIEAISTKRRLDLSSGGPDGAVLALGWLLPEPAGTWSKRQATIMLPQVLEAGPILFHLEGQTIPGPLGSEVELSLNGRALVAWTLHPGSPNIPPFLIVPRNGPRNDLNVIEVSCADPLPSLAERCMFVSGGRYLPALEVGFAGGALSFLSDGNGIPYLFGRWYAPEALGTWMRERGGVTIPIAAGAHAGFNLAMGWSLASSTRSVTVSINGQKHAFTATQGETGVSISVPGSEVSPPDLAIELECQSDDPGGRCIFLQSLSLTPAGAKLE